MRGCELQDERKKGRIVFVTLLCSGKKQKSENDKTVDFWGLLKTPARCSVYVGCAFILRAKLFGINSE
jgi:hypothetical protein